MLPPLYTLRRDPVVLLLVPRVAVTMFPAEMVGMPAVVSLLDTQRLEAAAVVLFHALPARASGRYLFELPSFRTCICASCKM